MPDRLVGIVVCLLLANVVNYALGEWLDREIPGLLPPMPAADGSSLGTSSYYQNLPDTALAGPADAEALLDFYAYLDRGGAATYSDWRNARASLSTATTPQRLRALEIADATNAGRYLALLLLILTGLAYLGGGLRETSRLAPLLYWLLFAATTGLYGALLAPVFTGLVAVLLLVYFGGLRLLLPIYPTEWIRLMRPGLTLCCFLLATMAWRGPELVDYWFWTSAAYRFGLVLVVLLTLFFHWSILHGILVKVKQAGWFGAFSYAMPLGLTVLVAGLGLGILGPSLGGSLNRLNAELALLPAGTVAGWDQDAPFALFFAGVVLLVIAGIGYSIKKISR